LGNLQLAGKLGAYPDYYGTRVRIQASGDNLSKLGEAAGISRLPARRFTTSGDVEWSARGVVLRAVELQAEPDRLTLDGRIGRDPLAADTDVRFVIGGGDLAELARSTGFDAVDGLPSTPYSFKGRLRREGAASRLDEVSGTLAGARFVASGRIGDTPARDTELKFSIDGPRLSEFAGLLPEYALPDGAFSTAGSIALKKQGLIVQGLDLSVAGAKATVDARLELPLSTASGRFNVQARGPELSRFLPRIGASTLSRGPFDLAARGTVADGRWKFEKAQLSTGLGRVSGSGTLDFAPDFSATTLQLQVEVHSLADVGRLADISLPQQPFAISADFSGTPTALVARNASGRLGAADFSGQLTVDLGNRPTVDLQLKTSILDLRPFTGGDAKPGKAIAARGAARNVRVIPDYRLALDWLQKFDGSLALQADRTRIGNLVLSNASLRSTLHNGNLRVEAFDAQAPPDGRLTVSGGLMQHDGIANLQITASGTRIALSLPAESAGQHKARPHADIELDLAGQGATLRELAASLDGSLGLMSGPGEVPGVDAGKYFGSLWRQMAGVVSPGFKPQPSTRVACLAAFISAKDGVLATVPALVLQTDRSNIIARGTVNLASEEIDALLRITTRKRLDINIAEIVNPNIRLVGTLASPSPRVDSKTTILGGGAAVATGGLSIVALNVWDRVFKAGDPCAEIAEEAKALEGGAAPKRRSLLPKLLKTR
ncbi:MAG: AsmA-like C-terminal region-containing protein, partial [Gammaproteobacteria bacterium]|nr:AsmA-like C-terminal region-containing protein [Gammaproteobacteria bacterium]